jgi:hypothetical protein
VSSSNGLGLRRQMSDGMDMAGFRLEKQKVFQQESFALSDIYLNTQCGVLKYSEIKK